MKESITINVTTLEKEARTAIHKDIKAVFQRRIDSTTTGTDDQKLIEIKRAQSKNGVRTDWDWPQQYVHFILYKENVDTVQAISALAQKLHMRPSNFNYAGTKDKRAKTTQFVSVRQVEPQRLIKATNRLHLIFVGNFKFCDKPLKLGMLTGNRFRIALRQVTASEAVINECLAKFKDTGFINYFGTQRFGNSATIPTYVIGKALVKQNFQEACELILKPREGDWQLVETMRKTWWEKRDGQEARDLLPKFCSFVEAKLLDGFIKTTNTDYMGALNNLPRNMRLLYMHSYQALLWNKVATLRIQKLGLKPCVGDLILVKDNDDIRKALDSIYAVPEDEPLDLEQKPAAAAVAAAQTPEENEELERQRTEARTDFFKNLVRPIKKNELNKFTIYDIVLPLPGHDVTYPENDVKKWYEDLLKEDGLTFESLKTKHKIYSLAGTYRKLLIKPSSFEWSVRKYEKPDENLILSDFEKLRGDQLPTTQDPSNTALILDFVLPPSTYATMALREILKKDTSPAAQVLEAEKIKQEKDNNSTKAEETESSMKKPKVE